jgi:AAA15 family ATPase/GTPase
MYDHLSIQNFKSVKNLQLNCKKVNVFIGEPNAGKSNILEALSFFSEGLYSGVNFNEMFRNRYFAELFFQKEVGQPVKISLGKYNCMLEVKSGKYSGKVKADETEFVNLNVEVRQNNYPDQLEETVGYSSISQNIESLPVNFYRFVNLKKFKGITPGHLQSPYGDNLMTILLTNKNCRNLISGLFKDNGLKLYFDESRNEISIVRTIDEVYSGFSFQSASETLRRITFLILALETNQNKVVVFDEPEANTFPFYTKYFAEQVAFDETNQFFFTTHNPYLLESIVAKTPRQDLNVSIAYMEDYETKLRVLSSDEINELMEMDVFFNLKRYTEIA